MKLEYASFLTLTELEILASAPLILFLSEIIGNTSSTSASIKLSEADIMQLHTFINSIDLAILVKLSIRDSQVNIIFNNIFCLV